MKYLALYVVFIKAIQELNMDVGPPCKTEISGDCIRFANWQSQVKTLTI